MKKISCLLILLIGTCCLAFAQGNKSVEGYNGLPWGCSVEEVKAKYPQMKIDSYADCVPNETFYEYDKGDTLRYFRFYNNKLYWVRVIYKDMNQTQFDSMGKKIKETYGGDWLDIEENNDPTTKFGYYLVDFKNLSRDTFITIEVKNILNGYGVKLNEWIFVTYNSQSLADEVTQAAADSFEL